ncbi:MAG: 23S rRNA pseudouridine(1911/1915/1917) synthase RluD [Proteobacteria bacterium]|nr:23S rRNA pseudouridine(1911/1915/1917) synthase RluD [Pseudomonadota bacterium]
MTETAEILNLTVPEELAGKRLDQALAELVADQSRAQLQQWIRDGRVLVGGKALKQRERMKGGELLEVRVPVPAPVDDWQPEALELDIIYEDDEILVLNKPVGLVVHPGAGNQAGTLLNALIAHHPPLATLARAGIVHRLDKNTSGLMVVSKTERSRLSLIDQLQERTVSREYMAVVNGQMVAGGKVNEPIGRHPKDRVRMAVKHQGGKPAVTHYRVEEKFRIHTLVRASLETGRTHQIRVHMTHINHPLVGDQVYGGRLRLPKACTEHLAEQLRGFKHQALHACRLSLIHPGTGESMSWEVPMPADMVALIEALREDTRQHS